MKLNKKIIEIDLVDNPSGGGFPTLDIPGMPGSQVGMINLNELLSLFRYRLISDNPLIFLLLK